MLKRIFSVLALTFLISAFGVSMVSAQELDNEYVENGPHFFSDRRVDLNDHYQGNVYVAAGELRLSGVVEGDLIVAGGSVMIDGTVAGGVYVLGGTVTISGEVGGSVTAAAAQLSLLSTGQVDGSIVGVAKAYHHEGNVDHKVMIGAKEVEVSGSVGQDAHFQTDRLTITDSAVISHNLLAEVRSQSQVSDQAVRGVQDVTFQQVETKKSMSPVEWSGRWLFSLLGKILTISIAIALFGNVIKKAATVFNTRWPEAMWKGAAFTVLVPLAILLLTLTVVGLPVAGTLGLVYLVVMMMAWVVPGYWFGRLLLPRFSPYAQGALGAIAVSFITLVPVFGWVARIILAVLGTGALLTLWRRGK